MRWEHELRDPEKKKVGSMPGRKPLTFVIAVWMAGGRTFDNIFIERLCRSLTYENMSINDSQTVRDARQGVDHYFGLVNTERLHPFLRYVTPAEVYYGRRN